jgi:hypothetical protein
MSELKQIRLVLSEVISGVTLVLALLYTIRFYDSSFLATLTVRGETLVAIALAAISFVLALRIRAPVVAGLLTLSGIVILIPPIGAIISDRAILIPGPILGVIFFSPIFVLGIGKFFTSYRKKKMVQTNREMSVAQRGEISKDKLNPNKS